MILISKHSESTLFFSADLLFAVLLFFITACDNGVDGDPMGPTNISGSSLITVSPAAVTVTKGDDITFTASGGTEPFTWSLDNTTLASIVSGTGVATAGTTAGSVTITATDANGSSGTATLTISNKTLTIVPATAQVGKTLTQAFTATGQTDPSFWSVASTVIGTIDTDTGIFTAGVTVGPTTVTLLDADGDTASATVSVITNTIIVAPVTLLSEEGTQPFTATTNGVAGTYLWTVSGETNDYSGATVTVSTVATVGTTLTFEQPTELEGDQTLTLTATDGNGDTGSATITLTAVTS